MTPTLGAPPPFFHTCTHVFVRYEPVRNPSTATRRARYCPQPQRQVLHPVHRQQARTGQH